MILSIKTKPIQNLAYVPIFFLARQIQSVHVCVRLFQIKRANARYVEAAW